MGRPVTVEKAIDKLPAPLREQVFDMMLKDTPSRHISDYLSQKGYKVSFNNVARYKRDELPAKLEIGRKLREISAVQNPDSDKLPSLASLTNAVQAADPLLSRVLAKYSRYDAMLAKAQETGDLSGFAAVDRAETQALTLHANLTGRLQSAQPTSIVQIVIGAETRENTVERADDRPGDTIDIAAVRE